MNRGTTHRVTFTLAGALIVVAIFAACLAAGREFGYLAIGSFIAAPWPVIGYTQLVRRVMNRFDFEARSRFSNVVLAIGLFLAGCTTLLLFGAGIENLKH